MSPTTTWTDPLDILRMVAIAEDAQRGVAYLVAQGDMAEVVQCLVESECTGIVGESTMCVVADFLCGWLANWSAEPSVYYTEKPVGHIDVYPPGPLGLSFTVPLPEVLTKVAKDFDAEVLPGVLYEHNREATA